MALPAPSATTRARHNDHGDRPGRRSPQIRAGAVRHCCGRCGRSRADYLYVLPAIVVMLVVIAYPIYYTIDLSFFKTPPGLQLSDKIFVGLDNYTAILTSDVFWRVTLNTVIWTLASTLIAFVLGFAAALALHRDFIGRGMLRAILIIPWVISAVAASYIWKWIYHSDFGIIGAVLVQLGLADRPPNFIDSVSTVLPSLIVVNIWREFPFAMIMMMAGLQTVPDQLLRAAQVDGATRMAALLARHLPASERRLDGDDPAARGGELQFLHHSLDHDRRRSVERLPHLDHAHLRARLRAPALGRGVGLFGAPVHHPDDAGLFLRACAQRRTSREAGRMSSIAETAPSTARRRKRIDGWRWAGRIFLVFMLLYTAVPMVWMLLTSIKSGFAAMQFPPQWWPDEPTLASYQKLLDPQNSVGQDFLRFFWNSLFVSTVTTILSVIVAVPAAYAFSRFSFPGRNFLFFSVLLRNMFPAVIFLVPLFILMRLLGLVNTHGSLVLTYLTFGLPLAIWLLKGFYDNIPVQLEQAARIDGATRFQAFLLIVMPLSVPGIIATAIYSFIGAWNEYIYAYTFLSKNDQLTLPVGIQRFFSENTTDFPGLMAASFMMSVPVVVLFLVLQKYFVRALTEGAVKH